MAWVCPMCSTNNEESESKCIVCDHERGSEKICTLTYNKVQKLRLRGNVVIPEEFNVIGEGAFKGRNDIYSVTLHDRVRKISKEAFCGCNNLRNIVAPCKLETVGIRAFAECPSLDASGRVKSKYVASDAYYIAPKPRSSPTPVSVEPMEPSVKDAVPDKLAAKHFQKTVRIALLGLLSLVLAPIAYWFSSVFQEGENVVYSSAIGVFVSLLVLSSVFFSYGDEGISVFSKRIIKVRSLAIALLLIYAASVIWTDALRWTNTCFSATLLMAEVALLGKTIYKKKYRFMSILIPMIVTNMGLLWRIIVA